MRCCCIVMCIVVTPAPCLYAVYMICVLLLVYNDDTIGDAPIITVRTVHHIRVVLSASDHTSHLRHTVGHVCAPTLHPHLVHLVYLVLGGGGTSSTSTMSSAPADTSVTFVIASIFT